MELAQRHEDIFDMHRSGPCTVSQAAVGHTRSTSDSVMIANSTCLTNSYIIIIDNLYSPYNGRKNRINRIT